jgi:hypothetical protein
MKMKKALRVFIRRRYHLRKKDNREHGGLGFPLFTVIEESVVDV